MFNFHEIPQHLKNHNHFSKLNDEICKYQKTDMSKNTGVRDTALSYNFFGKFQQLFMIQRLFHMGIRLGYGIFYFNVEHLQVMGK